MFRMWGKLFSNHHMLKDTVVCIDNNDLNRTRKIYQALEEICYQFDLQKPLWLETNKQDFIRHSKTRFTEDSFIETIDFDYLEIQVIEE
ncbi:hypothetical protein [Anaerostipes faecalis]|uniref:hypothetical protein n=1 Tax=Anaerostipes faecalis TaxID=2738446 RepID=UPI001C1E54AF|nr:hypothetical protein [Anaerostipes faecalis]